MKLLLVVLVAAAAGYLAVQHQRAAAETRELGEIASALAGRPVRVHCQNIAAAAIDVSSDSGSVAFDDGGPSDTAHLKRNVCRALGRFRSAAARGELGCLAEPDSCPRSVLADAEAAHVLTHESFHLRAVADEAEAECAALASTAWTAEQLGASSRDAELVARYARQELYPRLPAEYHSAACRA